MRVVLVAGPPCAGKSSYVAQHRGPDDVVIDFDALAYALGYPDTHVTWPADAHPARTIALRARASAIRATADTLGPHTVWFITVNPEAAPRGLHIDESHVLDPGKAECIARAENTRRDVDSARREIAAWYDRHGADLPSRSW